jgi:hypothetical protein
MTKEEFDKLFLEIMDSYPKKCLSCFGTGTLYDSENNWKLIKCYICDGTGIQR